jgi:gas vesicle protein
MGGMVGAGVALLLAPQSGTEIRRKIEELADDMKEKAADYAGTAKEKVVSTVDKAKELYEEKKAPSLQPLKPARKHTKKESQTNHA